MISEDTRKNQFALHYKQLELDDRADWNVARANYRRLVHLWHPDKFASRPREREHAQQQFIDLTKSYNELRDFYRKNKRLPFQSVSAARDTDEPLEQDFHIDDERTVDSAAVDASVLSRDPSERGKTGKKAGNTGKIIWAIAGLLIMMGTVIGFLYMDRKANQAIAEIGREVVKEAPESEFMPSSEDIRRSQTRGAFVRPTQ